MLEPVGLEKAQESYHELLRMKTPLPSLSVEKRARSVSTSLSGNVKCAACPDWMRSSVARGGQGWHSHAAVRSSLFTRQMTGEGGMEEGPVSGVKQLQLCQHARPQLSPPTSLCRTTGFMLRRWVVDSTAGTIYSCDMLNKNDNQTRTNNYIV